MAHADEAIVAALQDVWRMPTDRVIDIIQHLDHCAAPKTNHRATACAAALLFGALNFV